MKRFVSRNSFINKVAQNNDPMHRKHLYIKSYVTGAVLLAVGLVFLFTLGPSFTVFSWVLIVCSLFAFVDGLVTMKRK